MLATSLLFLATTVAPQGLDTFLQTAVTAPDDGSYAALRVLATGERAMTATDDAAIRTPAFSAADIPGIRYQDEATDKAAQWRSGFYVALDTGLSFIRGDTDDFFSSGERIDFDDSAFIGAALGYRFARHWRIEANVSYREADVDKVNGVASTGNVDVPTYMANIYYDFDFDFALKPYIGFGMGVGSYDLDTPGTSESDNGTFNLNAMLGVSCRILKNTDLNIGYRSLSVSDIFDTDLQINEFVIGVRHSF